MHERTVTTGHCNTICKCLRLNIFKKSTHITLEYTKTFVQCLYVCVCVCVLQMDAIVSNETLKHLSVEATH